MDGADEKLRMGARTTQAEETGAIGGDRRRRGTSETTSSGRGGKRPTQTQRGGSETASLTVRVESVQAAPPVALQRAAAVHAHCRHPHEWVHDRCSCSSHVCGVNPAAVRSSARCSSCLCFFVPAAALFARIIGAAALRAIRVSMAEGERRRAIRQTDRRSGTTEHKQKEKKAKSFSTNCPYSTHNHNLSTMMETTNTANMFQL